MERGEANQSLRKNGGVGLMIPPAYSPIKEDIKWGREGAWSTLRGKK